MPAFARRAIFAVFFSYAFALGLFAQSTDLPAVRKPRQTEGLYENKPQLVAITGATVTRFAGDGPRQQTILIRNDKIEAVGRDIDVPAGARVVDAEGLHIYPGFIDLYSEIEVPYEPEKGSPYWNDQVRPELIVADRFTMEDLDSEKKREIGITTALIAPKDGIIKGTSSLILMLDKKIEPENALFDALAANHYHLTVSRGRDKYPNSPMGAVALARQAHLDAQWFIDTLDPPGPERKKPDRVRVDRGITALAMRSHGRGLNIFETSNELFSLRADRFAREFDLKHVVLLGNGHEYRRIEAIAKTKRPIICPVNFPKPPEVGTPEAAADVSLESLMHWEHAPTNPAVLAKAGIPFCFTAHGLKKDDAFLENVQKAVDHGLSQTDALAALTTAAAKLTNHQSEIGKIEPGFLANLVITDKQLFFDKEAKILQTWVAGKQYEIEDEEAELVVWEMKTSDKSFGGGRIEVNGDKAKLYRDKETNSTLKHQSLSDSGIAGSFKSDQFGTEGWAQISVAFASERSGSGTIVLPDGNTMRVWLEKSGEAPFETKEDSKPIEEADMEPPKPISKVNFPFGYAGVESPAEDVGRVLIKGATIWTCGDAGVLEDAAVLFSAGKIESIFESGAALPAAEVVIDGSGLHLTPGIIDCHSHMASDSGINESGQAITAEVRIGDMVDCDDITIYRQLAGGVTTANVLHGSANPIGGQNQVIKLRWGALDEEMKFKGAPGGIKFALGENVKQSNWDNPTDRYPQTRMGVEQLFENAFEEAKLYRAKQKAFKKTGEGVPPRINLELEAIAEILEGKRWIHCHSYRQDEILSLLRLLERNNVQIGTFQHILEGYKVADEMAKHGAMGSAFSDWWAYKYEVKDAIPHAGAMMHRRGVVMSFNSDDGELGRHLNKEAAKAVRYGGLSYEEALNFVTINPAKQLRIDDRVGSIEAGKDADLVLWSNHPLSNLAVPEQTWIDGKKYFDRQEDAKRHTEFVELKRKLIQKVLRSGEEMEAEDAESTDPAKFWPRHDAFCHHKHEEGHDHDDDHDDHE